MSRSQEFFQRIQSWGRANRRQPEALEPAPAAQTYFIGVSASKLEETMREGVVATGAFFTFLPSAYTDEARARENANKTHGPDAHVLAVDTALVPDVSLWQPDASDPGRMAVWGLIPPRALSEVQPESIPTL